MNFTNPGLRIGWIGLGAMGLPMARRASEAGHRLTAYVRSDRGAEAARGIGADACPSPRELADGSDVVFTILATPQDVEEVYLGPAGLFGGSVTGRTFVDMTTSSPMLAQRLSERGRTLDATVLDAPVSGGPRGAEQGTLVAMVGGVKAGVVRTTPVLSSFAKRIIHVGPAGQGQTAKLINQVLVGATTLGLGEAFRLSEASGIPARTMGDVIQGGVAGSPLASFLWDALSASDFDNGFRIELLQKDLALALNLGRESGQELHLTSFVHAVVVRAIAVGAGAKGTQALVPRGPSTSTGKRSSAEMA